VPGDSSSHQFIYFYDTAHLILLSYPDVRSDSFLQVLLPSELRDILLALIIQQYLERRSASHRGGPDSIPDQVMWRLRWTRWVALRQVFSEYFGFRCQTSFHRLLHSHHHRHHLSSGTGTIGQLMANVINGLSLPRTPRVKSGQEYKL
jgi:hypothetical protein